MPLYDHVTEVKKTVELPIGAGEDVGICLTCKYWDVEETRDASQVPQLALCVQSELKQFALIVSGSSGCNKWTDGPERTQSADEYDHQGE